MLRWEGSSGSLKLRSAILHACAELSPPSRLMSMASVEEKQLPNLYLIGFMGVGKSTVGRRVAQVLSMQFLDSDAAIEAHAGRSISEIFAEGGEALFRQLERDFVENRQPNGGHVIACGGGLVTQAGIADHLLQRGVIICLFASVETILERTLGNTKRPLLQVANPENRIRQLLAEREPIYRQFGCGICTDHRPFPDVVHHVVRVYQAEARHFPFRRQQQTTDHDG